MQRKKSKVSLLYSANFYGYFLKPFLTAKDVYHLIQPVIVIYQICFFTF